MYRMVPGFILRVFGEQQQKAHTHARESDGGNAEAIDPSQSPEAMIESSDGEDLDPTHNTRTISSDGSSTNDIGLKL